MADIDPPRCKRCNGKSVSLRQRVTLTRCNEAGAPSHTPSTAQTVSSPKNCRIYLLCVLLCLVMFCVASWHSAWTSFSVSQTLVRFEALWAARNPTAHSQGCPSLSHHINTEWAKKPDRLHKSVTRACDDTEKRSIYRNSQYIIRTGYDVLNFIRL